MRHSRHKHLGTLDDDAAVDNSRQKWLWYWPSVNLLPLQGVVGEVGERGPPGPDGKEVRTVLRLSRPLPVFPLYPVLYLTPLHIPYYNIQQIHMLHRSAVFISCSSTCSCSVFCPKDVTFKDNLSGQSLSNMFEGEGEGEGSSLGSLILKGLTYISQRKFPL